MARTRSVESPASSDVYFGMVLCSFFAILFAVGLLVWELSGTYGFESTPAAVAAPALPKVPPRAAGKADGAAMALPAMGTPAVALTPQDTPAPVVAEKPEEKPVAPAAPGPIPSTVTATPKAATPAATPTAAPVPAGPTPGFEFPKRK